MAAGTSKSGNFLNAAVSFLIIASVVYFAIVLPLNHLVARLKKPEPEAAPSTKTCPECLSEIPLAAKRCAPLCAAGGVGGWATARVTF